ncbi:hypothetical protein SO694_00016325 [Aureococcus anophagefferens]|uniref:Uncharacterized protein n=1 Tax=Aureococcus anophagefferens TaxID=44056 RepID=A0ABR1G2C5_AURAN
MRFVGLLLVSLRRDARARSGSPVPAIGVAARPREARATFGARGDDAAAQPAAPAHADRRLDAVCDNSLGEAFATSPGATFRDYAYAACYASYGAQCVEGSCGNPPNQFQYYYYEPDGDCACHKTSGTYEFVFSNSATSDISIGVDYLDEDNNLIEYGNQLFVRKKYASGCGNNAWSLHYDFPDDNLCQATHAPTSMPTASSSSPSPVPSSSRPSPAPSVAPSPAPSMSAAPSSSPCTAQNSLGEAFGTSPGTPFQEYAYAACYASYGAQCVEGSCGSSSAFQYYYYQPDGHCSWSKAPGTYEFVFSNSASSAISVGDPYSHDDQLIEPGNQLFVRNSLGHAFSEFPDASMQEVAYAACYASYGAQCVEGVSVERSFDVPFDGSELDALDVPFDGSLADSERRAVRFAHQLTGTVAKLCARAIAERGSGANAERRARAIADASTGTVAKRRTRAIAERRTRAIADASTGTIAERRARAIADASTGTVAKRRARAIAERGSDAIAERGSGANAERRPGAIAERRARAITERGSGANTERFAHACALAIADHGSGANAERRARAIAELRSGANAKRRARAIAELRSGANAERRARAIAERGSGANAERRARAIAERGSGANAECGSGANTERRSGAIAERCARAIAERCSFSYATIIAVANSDGFTVELARARALSYTIAQTDAGTDADAYALADADSWRSERCSRVRADAKTDGDAVVRA